MFNAQFITCLDSHCTHSLFPTPRTHIFGPTSIAGRQFQHLEYQGDRVMRVPKHVSRVECNMLMIFFGWSAGSVNCKYSPRRENSTFVKLIAPTWPNNKCITSILVREGEREKQKRAVHQDKGHNIFLEDIYLIVYSYLECRLCWLFFSLTWFRVSFS